MYSISVNNLTKKFGSFVSVDNISFNVKDGEIFGFLGANGAGKSTTIRMLCGILEPSSGDALVGGFSINSEPDKVKSSIGYMSQRFSLYNDLTVQENIDFFGGVYGLSSSYFKERKNWVLEIANLKGKENLLTGSLPGGIKQRLALGTAVIHNPKIVFLDEPTTGLHAADVERLLQVLFRLREGGNTVLVIEHHLDVIKSADYIIDLGPGGGDCGGLLVAAGSPEAVAACPNSATGRMLKAMERRDA